MMMRKATSDDVPRLVEMGHRFLSSTSYAGAIADNPDQMAATASMLIEHPHGCVLVAENEAHALVGMLGAIVYAHHISGESVCGEVFWWVEPEHRGVGVRLLRAIETWATGKGALKMQMIAPTPDVCVLYERLGYAPVETAYQRTLGAR
ncbi:MAG: GNAT family N-acetyltransferase [Acidobacteriota bacterium]|nr:GNAT family N-acetyltransferase [Acidobacteriota bacterium]